MYRSNPPWSLDKTHISFVQHFAHQQRYLHVSRCPSSDWLSIPGNACPIFLNSAFTYNHQFIRIYIVKPFLQITHIVSSLCAGFYKHNIVFPCLFLSFIHCNLSADQQQQNYHIYTCCMNPTIPRCLPFIVQVSLVSYQHDDHVSSSLSSHIINPFGSI